MDSLTTTTTGATPRSVDAGRGVGWWQDAWTLFMKNAGMWLVMGVILLVIFIVLNVIPFIGGLAAALLGPVFVGGWMLAARKLEGGGTLEVGDLFSGFQDKLSSLVIVGALLLGAVVVIGIVAGVLGMGALAGAMMGGANNSGAGMAAAMGTGALAVLVTLALSFVLGMAFWFAPALVVFRNLSPVDALKTSFSASLKNIVAIVLFGVLYFIAAIVASIPFGIGWLLLLPLVMLAIYASYKDVFEA